MLIVILNDSIILLTVLICERKDFVIQSDLGWLVCIIEYTIPSPRFKHKINQSASSRSDKSTLNRSADKVSPQRWNLWISLLWL